MALQDIQKSFEEMQKRLQTEGITDASGKVLVKAGEYNPATNTISAENLKKYNEAANIPPPPNDTYDYNSIINSGNAQLGITSGNNNIPDYLKSYLESMPQPTNPMDTYNQVSSQAGLEEKQKAVNESQTKVNALKAQLAGITAETQAGELAMKGEGLNMAGATARNITRERQAAIRALPIQAQILAEQATLTGNQDLLSQAQDKINTVFQIQTNYQKQINDYNQKKIDAVYNYATKEQQDRLDAKKEEDTREYNLMVNNLNQAQNWATTAITNGQGALASQIMALDPNDANYQTKLAQLAGQIKIQEDLDYKELPDGRAVMVDKRGNIIKVISGGAGEELELPKGTPAEIKNSSTITNIISNSKIGQGTKTVLANILGVINASEDLAKANQLKGFKGVSPLNSLLNMKIPFTDISIVPFRQALKSKEAIQSEGYINAINLKVQQWASGAALTKQQTEQVERFTPKMTDTDNAVRTKLNNLTNFMYTQAKSALQSEGIKYTPEQVNLFEIYDLWKKASPAERKEIETLINQ